MARRWIRLDVGWSDSEWVGGLDPAGRLAWIELLTYAKRDGVGGVVKALSPISFGRKARIPAEDVAAMLEAALQDGALTEVDGDWIITGWSEYQETDPTAKERMRRHRAERSSRSVKRDSAKPSGDASYPVTRNNRNEPSQPVTGGVTRRVTETETETIQELHNDSYESSGKPPKIESPIPAVSGMFQVGHVLAGATPPAPERKKAPEVKPVTAEEAAERFARCRSQIPPAIRLHAWQGEEPPCSPDRNNPWHMGRELSIAKELLKQFTPEELLGGIEYFRETHPSVASGPWTLAMAYREGDRWRMMRAVDRWRSAQIDAIDPATLPIFTPHLSIHAA